MNQAIITQFKNYRTTASTLRQVIKSSKLYLLIMMLSSQFCLYSQTDCIHSATLSSVPSSLKGCDFTFPVVLNVLHGYPQEHTFKVTIYYGGLVAINNFDQLQNVTTSELQTGYFQTIGYFTVNETGNTPPFFEENLTILFDRLRAWGTKPEDFKIVIEDENLECPWTEEIEFGISSERSYTDLRTTPLTKLSELLAAGYFADITGAFDSHNSAIVDDELIIDQTFSLSSFNNTIFNEIILMPGAKINVTTGTFALDFIKVHTCGNTMAEGIVVNSFPNNSPVLITNSEILDCHYGINAAYNAELIVDNTKFLNNYVGINLDMSGAPDGMNSLVVSDPFLPNLGISNCFFGQALDDNTLLPLPIKSAYTGMTHQVGDVGLAGIVLLNYNDFKLFGSKNFFDKMANGILATRSNFHIFEASFSNIGSDFSGYTRKGYGIFAQGTGKSNWMQIGLPWATMPFENCNIAIYADKMAGSIDNCVINKVRTGISWNNSQLRDIYIHKNTITAEKTGIRSFRNEPLTFKSSISGNSLTITEENGRGIDAYEYGGAPKGGWRVTDNEIFLNQSGGAGIHFRNGVTNVLKDNAIFIKEKAQGIHIEHCNDADIVHNDILSGMEGIYAQGNIRDTIQCNNIAGAQTGIHIIDLNDQVRLMANQLSQHNIGLEYGSDNMPDAYTGVQNHLGNTWNNTTMGTWGAFHHNPDDVNASLFIVDNEENPAFMPETKNPFFWFKEDVTDTYEYYCPSPPPSALDPEGEIEEIDIEVAKGLYQPLRFGASLVWKAEYRLYRKLLEMPRLAEENDLMLEFKQSHSEKPLGQLANIAEQSKKVFLLTAQQHDKLSFFHTEMDKKKDRVSTLDHTSQTGIAVAHDEYAQAVKEQIRATKEYTTLLEQYALECTQRAKALLVSNSNILPTSEIESNHQMVNAILLNMSIENTPPDATQEEILRKIAHQCPQTGGDAVYEARAALGYLEIAEEYQDEANCGAASGNRLSQGRAIVPLIVGDSKGLYPNPATDWVYLPTLKGTKMEVFLYNQLGAKIKSSILNEDRLYLGNLPEGMYRIHLFSEGRLVLNQNIIHINP